MEALLIGIGMNVAAACGVAHAQIGLGIAIQAGAANLNAGALNFFQNLGTGLLTSLGTNIAALASGLL